MNGALLQSRIYNGYAQAANHIGLPFQQYRPTSAASAVIASGNLVQTLSASFNVLDMKYSKSSNYGKAAWYCLADGRQIQPGDYFIGNGFTYFIGAMEPLLPIFAALCNRTVSLFRPQETSGTGLGGYGGNTTTNQTPTITQFPASILSQSKADKAPTNLPGDVRTSWVNMLLPVIPGNAQILPNDIVTDDLGNKYIVSYPELAEHGWRCSLDTAVP